jgi:hypothetical protein
MAGREGRSHSYRQEPRRGRAPRVVVTGVPPGLVLAVLLLTSPGLPLGGDSAATGSVHSLPAANNTSSSCPQLTLPTPICHVFVIFLENQNESWVMKYGSFEEYVAKAFASASDYFSVEHYSYPNYVAATSGTATNYMNLHNEKNVVDLIRNAAGNLSWMAYLEDMPKPCENATAPGYRVAHNPFVFYTDIWDNQSYCQAHDVNFTSWYATAKSGNVPNYAFFGPNSTHSCWMAGSGVKVCDPWLRKFVSPMINSTYFASTAIFITYDEGPDTDLSGINGTTGGGHIYTAVVSPYACRDYASTTQYNHYDLLTTTEWLLGLGRTGYNDSWSQHPPMYDLFCFPGNSTGERIDAAGTGSLPATNTTVSGAVAVRARDASEG